MSRILRMDRRRTREARALARSHSGRAALEMQLEAFQRALASIDKLIEMGAGHPGVVADRKDVEHNIGALESVLSQVAA